MLLTGAAMFSLYMTRYLHNPAIRVKVAVLVLH